MRIAVISNTEPDLPFKFDWFKAAKKPGFTLEELDDYEFILVCGSLAYKALKLAPKFQEAKGLLVDGRYFVTITQEEADFDPKKGSLYQTHLRMFEKIRKKQNTENKVEHTIVISEEDFDSMWADIQNSPAIAIDTETSGLSPFVKEKWMASIGIATENHAWTVPLEHTQSPNKGNFKLQHNFLSKLAKRCRSKEVIGHNGKFDTIWIYQCYGVWIDMTFDTMLAHYNLDENSMHGLDILANKYLGASIYDIPLKEKWGLGSLTSHCHYLAMDIRYTYDLYLVFKELLKKDPMSLEVFQSITMPVSRIYARATSCGVYLNPKTLKGAIEEQERLAQEAKAVLDKYGDINWNSPKQVIDILFNKLKLTVLDKTPSGTPSVSESVLQRLAHEHEVPKALINFRGANKNLNTFLGPWTELIEQSGDSCIHPNFKVHGTVTGRPSCSEPNLQQVPRDPAIRSIIDAPEGYTLVESDLSQAELRIAAEMSQDRELRTCYLTGVDVHTRTVESIMGIDPAVMTKEERKKGKAINFGFIYGMGAKKFTEYARDNYGQNFSEDESKEIRKSYFKLYNSLPDWHKRQRNFVRKHGYVRSLIGRKRRLPEALLEDNSENRIKIAQAERNAINSPVQSLASDINLCAFISICEKYQDNDLVRPCGTIHDAIMLIVRNDVLDDVCRDLKNFMENPPLFNKLGIKFSIPIVAEVELGPWGKPTGKWE